jgi:hypothetical protein
MANYVPVHGNPNSRVFGVIGAVIDTDDGYAYIKKTDDMSNVGWTTLGGDSPVESPTPTPTPTITSTSGVAGSPTPTQTETPTLTPTITPTIAVTPTCTVTPTPSRNPRTQCYSMVGSGSPISGSVRFFVYGTVTGGLAGSDYISSVVVESATSADNITWSGWVGPSVTFGPYSSSTTSVNYGYGDNPGETDLTIVGPIYIKFRTTATFTSSGNITANSTTAYHQVLAE